MSSRINKDILNKKEFGNAYNTPTSKVAKSREVFSAKGNNVKSNYASEKNSNLIDSTTKKVRDSEIISKKSPRVLEYKKLTLKKLEMGYEKQINKTINDSPIKKYSEMNFTPGESSKLKDSTINEETYKKPYYLQNQKTMEKTPVMNKSLIDSKTRSKSKTAIVNRPPLYTGPRPSIGSIDHPNYSSIKSVRNKSNTARPFSKIASEKNIHEYSQLYTENKQNNKCNTKLNDFTKPKKAKISNDIYFEDSEFARLSKTYDNLPYDKAQFSEKSNKNNTKKNNSNHNTNLKTEASDTYDNRFVSEPNINQPTFNQNGYEKLKYNDYFKPKDHTMFYNEQSSEGMKPKNEYYEFNNNMNFGRSSTYEYPEISEKYDHLLKITNSPGFDISNDTQYKISPSNDSKYQLENFPNNDNFKERLDQDNLGNYAKNLSVELLDKEEELLKEKIRELKNTKRALRTKKRQVKCTIDKSFAFFGNLFKTKQRKHFGIFFDYLSHNSKKL